MPVSISLLSIPACFPVVVATRNFLSCLPPVGVKGELLCPGGWYQLARQQTGGKLKLKAAKSASCQARANNLHLLSQF